MRKELLQIIAFKPEIVSDLPEWMIPAGDVQKLKEGKKAAIVEIAGRDSIAAAIEEGRSGKYETFLPSIVYTGTEYGSWEAPFDAASFLKQQLQPLGINVLHPVLSGSPKFWWNLCGRSNYQLTRDYGFYTPCIGCHMYFHAVRIPLAKKFGITSIIAGERESHDGRIKLNQLGISLDHYKELCYKYGIELEMPLRYVKEGKKVSSILDVQNWKEGDRQLSCVLSKNYVYADGSVNYSIESINTFLKEFVMPEAEKQLSFWLNERC